MFCQECGKEIPNDSRFCPECGARFKNAPPVWQLPARTRELSPERLEKRKKRNKWIAAAAASILAVCLALALISIFTKPSINLNKYLTVTFKGYDTAGTAEVRFNEKKFKEDYGKKLGERDGFATERFLSACVSGSLDSYTGLRNGDTVTYVWDCDDAYAMDEYGYKLKYQDEEYVVEGLEEAETFDPFEGIEVIFEGISPNGTAKVDGNPINQEARDLYFQIEKNNGLENDMEVTVTVSCPGEDPVEHCIKNYGKIPALLEKTYKVEGLNSYVESLAEISSDGLSSMQRQAEDIFSAHVAKNWGETEKLEGFSYLGNYLLKSKNGNMKTGRNNLLCLVYKARVRNVYSNGETSYNSLSDIYWYAEFCDLLVNPEGELTVNLGEYFTPNEQFSISIGKKKWTYYGYPTLDELYKRVVMFNLETFSHEDNVEDETTPAQEENTQEETPANVEESNGTGPEAAADGEGMIFQDSSVRLLLQAEAEALNDEELRYAINELYARHGYIFKDENLGAYYRQYDWYKPTIQAENFSSDIFNEIEMANIRLLQAEREKRG